MCSVGTFLSLYACYLKRTHQRKNDAYHYLALLVHCATLGYNCGSFAEGLEVLPA